MCSSCLLLQRAGDWVVYFGFVPVTGDLALLGKGARMCVEPRIFCTRQAVCPIERAEPQPKGDRTLRAHDRTEVAATATNAHLRAKHVCGGAVCRRSLFLSGLRHSKTCRSLDALGNLVTDGGTHLFDWNHGAVCRTPRPCSSRSESRPPSLSTSSKSLVSSGASEHGHVDRIGRRACQRLRRACSILHCRRVAHAAFFGVVVALFLPHVQELEKVATRKPLRLDATTQAMICVNATEKSLAIKGMDSSPRSVRAPTTRFFQPCGRPR